MVLGGDSSDFVFFNCYTVLLLCQPVTVLKVRNRFIHLKSYAQIHKPVGKFLYHNTNLILLLALQIYMGALKILYFFYAVLSHTL